MQRRREIAVDDEEELLALQEQFAASAAQGDARPAAKVTRVSRSPATPAGSSEPPVAATAAGTLRAAGCSEHGPACSGHHDRAALSGQQAAGLMASLQAAMQNIVGEVQEREVAPPAAPAPPASPVTGPSSDAFPQATHRKLSKFALGRQRQRAVPASTAQPPAQLPPEALPASLDEGARIDAENRQLLGTMTPEQLAEAREEALQRLPPSAVEFLRRRGAQKAAAAAAAAAPQPPGAAGGGAGEAPVSGQQASSGLRVRAVQRARRQQQGQQQQQRQQQQQEQLAGDRAGGSPASLAGRLRFGMDGSIVGLRPAAASSVDVAPADVAQRDPIRQASGEGYSVQEACLLARSSVPQQRVLALRLLGAVLARARPRPCGAPGGGPVPLPADVAAELAQELQQAQNMRQPDQLDQASQLQAALQLDWLAVWHHALHAADITLLLRRSLDDQHVAVAAAAAEALAALLGAAGPAGAAEEAATEAADASPLTGLPAPPLRHLQRPTAGGAWVAAPTSPDDLRQAAQGGGQQGQEEDEEEPLDEQQLAKVDPLSGLLHMQLLERAVYLIVTARAAPALDALLSILIRCCQAGKDVADQVAGTPGMLAALKTVLDAPPPSTPEIPARPDAPGAEIAGEGSVDAAAAAFYAARLKALRLLRHLAVASKAAARRLQESGLVRFALEHLLRAAVAPPLPAAGASPAAGAGVSAAALASTSRQCGSLSEALRLWRSFAQHGLFLALLDDAYPSLCNFFSPPAAAAAAAAAGRQAGEEDLQQWCVAREAYAAAAQLCWQAGRGGPEEAQLSPQCAAALASGALSWLASLPLEQLLRACLAGHSSSSSRGDEGSSAAGQVGRPAMLGASPALAAANAAVAGSNCSQQAVLLGALAAALHYAGSYWSMQVWHTAADRAAAVQQLVSLGMLPAAGEGSGGGSSSKTSMPAVLELVSQLLEQLVASDATWRQQIGDSCSSSDRAAQAAAAVATAELAVALARLAATFLPQQQAAAAASALLAPLCSPAAAARFLHAAAAADATLSQPWDAARQAQLLPLARAATAGLQMAALLSKAEGRPMPKGAADTALALLRLLPPGDEPGALQLLALLLGPQLLGCAQEAATAALHAAQASSAAVLACDGRDKAADAASSSPPALPPVEQLSPVLLAGYAAAWLGLVPEQDPGEERPAGSQSLGGAEVIALEPPANATLLRPQGSRMPLPLDWALAELPLPPAEAGVAADPATAAGGALALMLGWEEQRLAGLASNPADSAASAAVAAVAEQKLRSAVLLLFGEQQEASLSVVPRAAKVAGQEAESPVWQDPLSRWCLAALMGQYASAAAPAEVESPAGGSQAGSSAWQQQEARQLAERFAAASYGDWLFGAAVALLLRQAVAPDTQLEVLSTLADEQALHLLPPLCLLPGPPASYPRAPATAGGRGSSFGRACFGATAAEGGGSVSSRRQELDLYVKLLSEGALERCLAAAGRGDSGGTGDAGAAGCEGNGTSLATCSAAVPLVLHRLACACFPDVNQQQVAEQQATEEDLQRQALLCGILQRCAGGSSEAHQLLGWLLRWDASAAQPSDAIDSQRLGAIEAACAAAGLDAARLLEAAVEA